MFNFFNIKDLPQLTWKILDGHYIHHYIKSDSPGTSPTRISRLTQELSDLSNALPIDSTNAIFVRTDNEKVYLINTLVMGSAGIPYAHRAFEFDLYWNWNYPRDPPKMNLMTTGGQAVRFNPNFYACGKVCLFLLRIGEEMQLRIGIHESAQYFKFWCQLRRL